ncbi:MAG: hypothetical protein HOY69_01830, partial [Streptomyces sp.]|nr:hypothetical protein [Streptomyces sp.]
MRPSRTAPRTVSPAAARPRALSRTVPRLAGTLLLVFAAGASSLGTAASSEARADARGAAVRPLGQVVPA